MHAMCDQETDARVSGVATMGTPFLVGQRRHYSETLSGARFGAIAAAIAYGPIAAVQYGAPAGLDFALSWLFVLVLWTFGFWILNRYFDSYQSFTQGVLQDMRLARIRSDRLLVLRSAGDEASVGLLTSQLLLSVGLVVTRGLAAWNFSFRNFLRHSIDRPLFGWWAGITIVGFCALVIAKLVHLIWQDPNMDIGARWMILQFVVLTGLAFVVPILVNPLLHRFASKAQECRFLDVCAACFLGPAMLLLLFVPSLLLLAFGWQLALANIDVEISAEPAPLGEWRVRTFPTIHSLGDKRESIFAAHSGLYDLGIAIDAIGDWVDELLKKEWETMVPVIDVRVLRE
ncbi:hypothetical protein B2J89_03635 [Acidovorax sp. SRB_24]|nr:hypothetical protein [Acidovorax sp. SRB_24]